MTRRMILMALGLGAALSPLACTRDDAREAGQSVGAAAQQAREGAEEFGEGLREGAESEEHDGDEATRR